MQIMSIESHTSSIEDSNFDRQFQNVETFDVGTSQVEVVDVAPEVLKTEVPTLIAPGWGCSIDSYRETLRALNGLGRRALTLNHPRYGNSGENEIHNVLGYPIDEIRKALNLIGILNKKKIGKADVVAHSEGAINATIAALLYPEKFRNLALYAPAGLIGKDNFQRLLMDFSDNLARERLYQTDADEITEEERMKIVAIINETLAYFSKNPVRGINEAIAISNTEIGEMLKILHDKGVGTFVISGVDDQVFPMNKIQGNSSQDFLDGFISVKGGHYDLQIRPEKYIKGITGMFDSSVARSEKK